VTLGLAWLRPLNKIMVGLQQFLVPKERGGGISGTSVLEPKERKKKGERTLGSLPRDPLSGHYNHRAHASPRPSRRSEGTCGRAQPW